MYAQIRAVNDEMSALTDVYQRAVHEFGATNGADTRYLMVNYCVSEKRLVDCEEVRQRALKARNAAEKDYKALFNLDPAVTAGLGMDPEFLADIENRQKPALHQAVLAAQEELEKVTWAYIACQSNIDLNRRLVLRQPGVDQRLVDIIISYPKKAVRLNKKHQELQRELAELNVQADQLVAQVQYVKTGRR